MRGVRLFFSYKLLYGKTNVAEYKVEARFLIKAISFFCFFMTVSAKNSCSHK